MTDGTSEKRMYHGFISFLPLPLGLLAGSLGAGFIANAVLGLPNIAGLTAMLIGAMVGLVAGNVASAYLRAGR